MAKVVHEIEPVFDENCRILMLGSIPSPKSREVGFYYGHPQNRFWPVLAAVLDEEVPQSIAEKKAMLLRHHIALWDVLSECEIKGAADVSIKEPVINDMSCIFAVAPIKAVFATGSKAAQLYRKLAAEAWGKECITLPSTSAANAGWSKERLIAAYSQILGYVRDEE